MIGPKTASEAVGAIAQELRDADYDDGQHPAVERAIRKLERLAEKLHETHLDMNIRRMARGLPPQY